jgi:hypothetical protein
MIFAAKQTWSWYEQKTRQVFRKSRLAFLGIFGK